MILQIRSAILKACDRTFQVVGFLYKCGVGHEVTDQSSNNQTDNDKGCRNSWEEVLSDFRRVIQFNYLRINRAVFLRHGEFPCLINLFVKNAAEDAGENLVNLRESRGNTCSRVVESDKTLILSL